MSRLGGVVVSVLATGPKGCGEHMLSVSVSHCGEIPENIAINSKYFIVILNDDADKYIVIIQVLMASSVFHPFCQICSEYCNNNMLL
jgi:hypothetical protein